MSKFTPSPQEVALVNQIFLQADTQKLGVITGEAAVKVFSGTKLSPSVLAEVWNLADEDNKGVLTRKDFAVAVRLLGHAQRGEHISEALIHKPGPPPTIEGFNAPLSGQLTGTPTPRSPPPGPAAGFPPLTPQDKTKFTKLFQGCGPVNGLLTGDKAREVFVKSKLPVDKLSQIWTLADTKNRGALDLTDFTVAMYLIQGSMSGSIQSIPPSLPPYIYDQAKSSPDTIVSHATGSSGFSSPTAFGGGFPGRPVSTIQPQYTGSGILQPQITGQRPAPPLPARAPTIPSFPLAPQATGQPAWDVTPTEKATFDSFFDTLDSQKRGYIEGDVAVPFMLQSKLSDDVLAQVWDLADLNNDGRLTRDGFAVAMHLIQGKLAGKDIPTTLPPSLIPPSFRSKVPAQPPQPSVPEGIKDLLWDDTPPSSATTSQPAVPAFTPPPFAPPRASTTSPKPAPPPASSFFGASDPFASASTSSPFTVPTPAQSAPPVEHKDLLGDDDEPTASSPPLQDKSAEIGNLQNQVHSTNRAVETSKREREDLEKRVADQTAQLDALQSQLTAAKASYETETRLLTTLRERYSTQTGDIQKSRQELIRAESDLSAVRVEKAEVEGALLRDKEEVRELNRKMAEVGTEVESLKAQMEKIKKEAKQQKGLLAIAKKQLATREAERAKVLKELEEAQAEADATAQELHETESALAKEPEPIASPQRVVSPSNESITAFAAAQPLPASPEPVLASPTSATSGKSTNPFERLTMGASPGTPRSQSPFLPFTTTASLPTPPVAPHPADSVAEPPAADPFGFEDAFGTEPTSPSEPPSAAAQTQSGSPFGIPDFSSAESDVMSPGTDHFMTPPSTATLQPTSATEFGNAPESAVSPAVESQIPGHFPSVEHHQEGKHDETDLNTQLKELEVDDSDTSDSEDDEPLTNVKAKLQHEPTPAASAEPVAGPSSTSAFDDSFGISNTEAPVIVSPPTTSETLAAPSTSSSVETPKPAPTSTSPFAVPQETVTSTNSESSGAAGVSDFDEALGKLSGGSGTSQSQFSHVSQFTFDDAFEDDFDFDAAKAATASEPAAAASAPAPTTASAFPPPPAQSPRDSTFDAVFLPSASNSPPPQVPGPAAAPAAPAAPAAKPFSFEDAFGAPSAPSNGNAAPAAQPAPSSAVQEISFDDAFGGHTNEALALDNSFTSTQQPSTATSHLTSQSSTPFPSSTPSSPTREPSGSLSSRRSMSPPPRATSPPPRTSSKSRPSTASSEKEKTRHSKLSIRLPFGRKKNKHDPMPSNLSHQLLAEEPPASTGGTPAAEDDIDAVKTLCSMGFSRTQAVTALEQHDYDVQRALNSLLGTR